MATEWDIPQRDRIAVELLSATIRELPMQVGSLGTVADRLVQGGSFSARLCAVPDRDRGFQLRIYFRRIDVAHEDRWSAWVRCDRSARADRTPEGLAKRFRRAFKPSKVVAFEADEKKPAPKFVTTAHWWVGPLSNDEDITAQVWLFLLQTGLVDHASRGLGYSWFLDYLERRFKVTDDESAYLFETLLKQFWRAPSGRSWPTYVTRCAYYLPNRLERRRQRLGSRNFADSSRDEFTVSDAAAALRIPESTLYDMLGRGKIASNVSSPTRNNRTPKFLISAAEVERLRVQRHPKPKALIERRQRATGSTYEAARKWVWRQLRRSRTMADIATQLANLRDAPSHPDRRARPSRQRINDVAIGRCHEARGPRRSPC